ncbi:MAG: carboxypeptidase regulatory-like domain-containing protein [Bryobacteraceae bacterium]|nr:carboxypeptidase regulatory-like domain-containing protein [Bryobacteraceae bacterium]MDW8377108.1 carboxypeptidase regulatory-like domain-containing protein [Bryobacterales bacterium]
MKSLLTVLTILCCASSLKAQAVKGTLLGTVVDSSQAAVPTAKVVIVDIHRGVTREMVTNDSGFYSFPNLEAGTYRVTVEAPGFQKAQRDTVEVFVNSTVRADFELKPGAVTETIEVQGEGPILQTDRADTGRRIETRQVADMPLGFNRNFQSLLSLVPGVRRSFRPHSEFFNSADTLSNEVNGQNRQVSNYQLEGVDNNHRTGLLQVLIPPIEAIAAVDISTSNYEAELGRASGAVINVTLKSGTNELHGSLFHFHRNQHFTARNFFAASRPPTVYNLFGFTLGGPIRKNQTFFFGDFQGIRDRRGDVNIATIPTMAFRQGNLSSFAFPVFDPETGLPGGIGRTPFPGNIIPASRISPISRRMLELIPPPIRPGEGANWERNTVREKDINGLDGKIDHLMGPYNRFSGRYSFQYPKVYDPPVYSAKAGGPSKQNGFAGTGTNKIHSGAINYTRIFSPTFIGEVRIGAFRYRNEAYNADYGLKTAEELGIPGVNISQFTSGIPQIWISGFTSSVLGYSQSLPWQRAETNFNYVTNWTKIRLNHTFKWGADIRRVRDDLNQNDAFGARGRFQFTEGTTALNAPGAPRTGIGNSFASFLLDLPNFVARSVPYIFPAYRQTTAFFFVQDKWQASRKLTIDIGLRYEYWRNPRPRLPGGFANYDPENNRVLVAGVGSIPMDLGRRQYNKHFNPRLGISYRLNQKTVVRTGFGISVQPLADFNYGYNFPVRTTEQYLATDAFSIGGRMATGFPPPPSQFYPPSGIIENAPLTQSFTVFTQDLREGYLQSWNFAIQRALPANFVLDVAYVGNQAVKNYAFRDINASPILNSGVAGQPLFQRFGRRAPVSSWHPTQSNYHSLQVKFDRRLSNGFLLTTAYTYSKAIDQDFFQQLNFRLNRATGNNDRQHIFVQSYIYELPFGRGKKWATSGVGSALLGGWQLSGILTLMTGTPLNIFGGGVLNTPGSNNRPDLLRKPRILGGIGRGNLWLETDAFADPGVGRMGTTGRNILRGPSFPNLDLSLFRRFHLSERFKAELRAESFNFSNTPKFANPDGNFTSPTFGMVTGAGDDFTDPAFRRQIQLGLKITF